MRLLLASLLALASSAPARAGDTVAPVVEHTPVGRTERGAKFVQVFAKITDASRVFPQVFFRYGPGEYQRPLDMKAVKGLKNQWGANIPVKGDLCEYYVEAYDELGNGPGRAGDPEKPYRVDTSGQGGMVAQAPAPAPPPQAAAPPPPAPAWESQPAPPPPPRQFAQERCRTWTWIAGGAGLGALAGGLIAYDNNKSLSQKATVLTIAGGVLLATSVVLFFVEGRSPSGSGGDVGVVHF